MKYHELSKNVSIVSVSRRAAPLHFEHVVLINSGTLASGFPSPPNFASRGNRTGKSSSFTGCRPQFSQYTNGIGVPQNRWREISQSRRRYCTVALPFPCASRNFTI